MPQVGPRKVKQMRNKGGVKTHFRMYMKESDHGFYEERLSSKSRFLSMDEKKQQSTNLATDENRLANKDKCVLLSSGQPIEKESSCLGMDRFWEGRCPPEVKDWVEGCQSPSASESSSSLSTQESSSFSGTSEASSLARMEFLQCIASQSARFPDFVFASSHTPKPAAISMQNPPTGTDRTQQQDSVKSYGYEYRKQQKGQDSFKLKSHEGKTDWNPNVSHSATGPSLSNQDKQNSDLDYSVLLELDGSEFDTAADLEEKIVIPERDQIRTSLEYLDEGFRSDSSSSTHSWASAYSQEFSSESWWQSFDALHESEDLLIHDDVRPNAACQIEDRGQIDFQLSDVENVEFFRHAQPLSPPKEEVQRPPNYDFYRESSIALRTKSSEVYGTKILTEARISAENKEVQFDGQTFHMSNNSHPGYDEMGLDACKGISEESFHVRSSEKPVNGSLQVPHELLPSSQSTLRGWSKEMHPRRASKKTLGLCEPLLPASHTPAGLPYVGAADNMKPFPSVGLKSRHSAAVKEKFTSKPLHGYFRFVEQGGLPCYTFFVNGSDEVLFARTFRPKQSSNKRNCDWIYSFHSRRDNGKVNYAWKGWGKKEKFASDLVGRMRVSHGPHNNNNKCFSKKGTKETRFILFNASEEQSLTARSDNIPHQPAPKFLEPVVDEGVLSGSQCKPVYQRATSNNLKVPNLSDRNVASNLRGPDCTKERSLKQRIDAPKQTPDSAHLEGSIHQQSKAFKSRIELASIVINTCVEVENLNRSESGNPVQKETVGWGVKFLGKSSSNGWGLKFLEKKADETQADPCMRSKEITECDESPRASRNSPARQQQLQKQESENEGCFDYKESILQKVESFSAENKELEGKNTRINANVDVTVILPAGDHGLPTCDSDGPTPLVERWRSGGNCECGGWDLGCGLSVFSTETLRVHGAGEKIALTSHDRINWLSSRKPLKIFTQDYRRKMVLGIEKIEAGFFSLRFQGHFSPLQAFATAVAILHEQVTNR